MAFSKQNVRDLSRGTDRRSRIFRFALLIFDVTSVVFFIATSMVEPSVWIYWVDGSWGEFEPPAIGEIVRLQPAIGPFDFLYPKSAVSASPPAR